jgi:hypothetical protein
MRFLLAFGLVAAGLLPSASAQPVASQLLSAPSAEAVRCASNSRVSRPGQQTTFLLYRYHIGVPDFQTRNSSGRMVMTGPPPRVVIAVFDQQGAPLIVIDSVFAAWITWAAVVEFDLSAGRESYRQSASIDSAEAMAIAMRLGPARIMEAGDSAERLRKIGEKQPLDTQALNRGKQLADLLWLKRCS